MFAVIKGKKKRILRQKVPRTGKLKIGQDLEI